MASRIEELSKLPRMTVKVARGWSRAPALKRVGRQPYSFVGNHHCKSCYVGAFELTGSANGTVATEGNVERTKLTWLIEKGRRSALKHEQYATAQAATYQQWILESGDVRATSSPGADDQV